MTSDEIAQLRRHRETGTDILFEFIKATPETAPGIVKRARAWALELIPLVEPFGDGPAALFKPLTPMEPKEQATVARCASLDKETNQVRANHAVRMYRLNELFEKFDPVLPKAPGGKRRTPRGRKKGDGTIDDTEVLAKMARLIESGEAKSVLDAATQVVEYARGSGREQSTIDRLRRKFKASDFKSNLSI